MKQWTRILVASAMLATLAATPVAWAADEPATGSAQAGNTNGWQVMAGGGLILRPTFEGSDHYTVLPVPVLSATYNDMISIGVRGLNAYWHRDNLKLGVGLTYHGGRKERKSGSFFSRGDDRLIGLGNIRSALGLRAFGSWTANHVTLSGAVTKYVGNDNRGVLVDIGASLPYRANDRLTLRPHLNITWADNSFMQTFFGVTPAQAANAMFPAFRAGAGVKDISLGINANYRFDRHWFLGVNGDIKRLLGDAARSPISFADTQFTLLTMVGYRF